MSSSDVSHPLSVWYEGREVRPLPQETVLDALIRAGINTPFSCKGGACLTCMLQCAEGRIPEKAQRALDGPLRKKGYFLPCAPGKSVVRSVRRRTRRSLHSYR